MFLNDNQPGGKSQILQLMFLDTYDESITVSKVGIMKHWDDFGQI